jgi:hypothetical protein
VSKEIVGRGILCGAEQFVDIGRHFFDESGVLICCDPPSLGKKIGVERGKARTSIGLFKPGAAGWTDAEDDNSHKI